MEYLHPPQSSIAISNEQLLNPTFEMDNHVFEFSSEKYEWLSQEQENKLECCKYTEQHTLHSQDVKNIIPEVTNFFHFCGLDDNKKCTSLTKIETFISNAERRSSEKNYSKTKKRLKVNMNYWTPVKLEICVQDIYCSDEMMKYIEPKYEKGTIVWVKMLSYPNWPAMIDDDPDYNTHWRIIKKSSQMVQYHVVFFDEERFVSRCWSQETKIKPFKFRPTVHFKSISLFQRFQAGFQQAKQASRMNIQNRINKYGLTAKMQQPDSILVEN